MRIEESVPSWAQRQVNRRMGRHANAKVVRWIAARQPKQDVESEARNESSNAGANDIVVAFSAPRSADAV